MIGDFPQLLPCHGDLSAPIKADICQQGFYLQRRKNLPVGVDDGPVAVVNGDKDVPPAPYAPLLISSKLTKE
jgi:hypothetical protein